MVFLLVFNDIWWLLLLVVTFLISTAIFFDLWQKSKGLKSMLLEENEKLSIAKRQLSSSNDKLQNSIQELDVFRDALEQAAITLKVDSSGTISSSSQNFLNLTGYTSAQIMGKRLVEIVNLDAKYSSSLFESLIRGVFWQGEVQLIDSYSNKIKMELNLIPLKKNSYLKTYLILFVNWSKHIDEKISEQNLKMISIQTGEELERKRISSELHDGLGQMLTGLKLNVESLKLENVDVQQKKLGTIKKLVALTIKECRRISNNLMPVSLERYGLETSLKKLVEETSKQSSSAVVFENNDSIPRMEKPLEVSIFRTIQEALNNALKYSEATQISIVVDSSETKIHFYVKDNGKGFDSREVYLKGSGLKNMKGRAQLHGGELFINSELGKGTNVHLVVSK